jgi:sugar phosphate isomerase/epimerase
VAVVDRRTFGRTLGALAGAALTSSVTAARARLGRIGLELYSVRDAMARDPEGTLAAVRAMGYDDVELLWSFGNFKRTPQQVRAALNQAGLRAPSAHASSDVIFVGWERSLEIAKLIGQEYIIIPSFSPETTRSLDDWREWADRFNTAGALARRAGIWLAFHNEPDHVRPIDGQVPYEVFLERTDPTVVRHQLDIGNMVMGGGDPMRYFEKYRNRYWSFHVKDVVPDRAHDTELGKGQVNLARFLSAVPDLDRKPCFVEQEQSADPLASARRNCEFLRSLQF